MKSVVLFLALLSGSIDHEITVTRVSPNQLTPATELCVTALWAQENKQGEVNYTEMLSSNILSDLWLFLMAK